MDRPVRVAGHRLHRVLLAPSFPGFVIPVLVIPVLVVLVLVVPALVVLSVVYQAEHRWSDRWVLVLAQWGAYRGEACQ